MLYMAARSRDEIYPQVRILYMTRLRNTRNELSGEAFSSSALNMDLYSARSSSGCWRRAWTDEIRSIDEEKALAVKLIKELQTRPSTDLQAERSLTPCCFHFHRLLIIMLQI
jgi:hypothetical protein